MKKIKFHFSNLSPVYIYWFAIGAATMLLVFRLFYLQIIHQKDFRLQSDQNRIREVTLQPLRGLIYDRNGQLLVNNEPAFTLYALPYYLNKNPEIYAKMASFVGLSQESLQHTVSQDMLGYFKPVRLFRQLDFSLVSKFEENRREFPGVDFWIEPIRSYPSPVKAAHLFGYLGEISATELENDLNQDYQKGDVIGKKGIERYYEDILHGKPGMRYVEVDVLGREIKTLDDPKSVDPVPGHDLYLTIDSDLQLFAEQLMAEVRGSIIMMDLKDGGILVLVSKPDYSPQLLSGVISPTVWNDLSNDPDHPMYDRSIQSVYPPGSTFKLVLALAAITNHTIDPNWTVYCPGYFQFGRRAFKCWNAKGHGRVNLYQAIEQSCNVYFYQLGLKVGVNGWAKIARTLRFGEKSGIDLPLENKGNVPDKKFLDNRYGEGKWTNGLMLNLAVGQGDLVVTPIQMLQMTAIIAKRGIWVKPHLLYYHKDPVSGKSIFFKKDTLRITTIPDTAYQIIRRGMRMVVNGSLGTGKGAAVPQKIVAGKTGTAQNPHGNSHAWFVGFAPFDAPEVAIVVLVENGGGGSAISAPKAGALLRLFFQKQKEQSAGEIIAQTSKWEQN